MTDQLRLADLLDAHMTRLSVGNQRLANQVNALNGNAHFISRSTIRNWRTGSAQKANSWLQLATVAVALELNEADANTLLKSGGCLSIQAFTATAEESDQALLAFWRNTPNETTAASSTTVGVTEDASLHPHVDDRNTLKSSSERFQGKRWRLVSASVFAVAGLAAVFGILSADYFQSGDKGSAEIGTVIPVIRKVSLGRQCLIDLAAQPSDPVGAKGVAPDNCPELDIHHNYDGYANADLVAWDKGVAQCWVNRPLERIWIGFDLPGGGEGWLRLTTVGDANYFKETEPLTPTLWESPEFGSDVVGVFPYDELAGNATKLLLDFPEQLDPTTAYENGEFHLAGCWQVADRDGFRGLHFFWPHGSEI